MRIYRCDHCGSRYDEEPKTKISVHYDNLGLREKVDLCPTCNRQLNDWLMEGETWRIEHK